MIGAKLTVTTSLILLTWEKYTIYTITYHPWCSFPVYHLNCFFNVSCQAGCPLPLPAGHVVGCDLRSWSFLLLYCSIENATIYCFYNSVLFLVTLQNIYQSCRQIVLFSVRLSLYNSIYLFKIFCSVGLFFPLPPTQPLVICSYVLTQVLLG